MADSVSEDQLFLIRQSYFVSFDLSLVFHGKPAASQNVLSETCHEGMYTMLICFLLYFFCTISFK
jgi:hypothetical protein